MTGLTNGQLYEFAVRAVNGVGDGVSIAQGGDATGAVPDGVGWRWSGGVELDVFGA